MLIQDALYGHLEWARVPTGKNLSQRVMEVKMPDPMRSKYSSRQRKRGNIEELDKQYYKMRHSVLASDAWRHLPPAACKVYLEICRRYYGKNNGKISLSLAEAADILYISKNTAQSAIKKLIEHGFIKRSRIGSFIGRRASEFILTDKGYEGYQPTNDWMRWRPKPKWPNADYGIEAIRRDAEMELDEH